MQDLLKRSEVEPNGCSLHEKSGKKSATNDSKKNSIR